MYCKNLFAASLVAAMGLIAIAAGVVIADAPSDSTAAGQPQFQLPPGWTVEDMQACMLAGTPGKMHEFLAKEIGTWHGKSSMWMVPGGEPVTSECTSTVSAMMDGRFTKVEMAGEMPGMGPYHGLGIYGFDNVSQKFVSIWLDNHSTGLMTGTGDLSSDGKTLTWNYNFNCPLTKKPTVMREVETITGPDSKTLEMFGPDPKTGKEFQMMKIKLTKKEEVR